MHGVKRDRWFESRLLRHRVCLSGLVIELPQQLADPALKPGKGAAPGRTLTLERTRGPRGSTTAEGHRKDAEPSPSIVDSRRVCLLIEFFTRQGKREDPAACAVDRSPCRDEQIFTQRCRCRVNGPFHGKLHEEPAGLRVISV